MSTPEKSQSFCYQAKTEKKNPNFSKPQNPAIEPAMQENKIEPNSLSTFRKGGGGKLIGETFYNDGKVTQPNKGDVRRNVIGQM